MADRGKEPGHLLADNDFDGFAQRLRSFFAGIPYQWHGKVDMVALHGGLVFGWQDRNLDAVKAVRA